MEKNLLVIAMRGISPCLFYTSWKKYSGGLQSMKDEERFVY